MKKIIISAICFLAFTVSAFAQETVAQITKDKVGQTVKLSGSVESFTASRSEKAPASLKLKDSTGGSIRVAIWPDVFNQIAGKDSIKPGSKVEVSAKVAEFRGSLELHVDSANDVKIEGAAAGTASSPATTPASAAAEKPAETSTAVAAPSSAPAGSGISAITKDKVKQSVTISGTVASFSPSRSEKAPASINLKDDSGSIRVAIWPDVLSVIAGKDDIKPGAKMTITATVAEFRGNIELHVDKATDVQISGAPAAKPAEASTAPAGEPAKTTAAPAASSGKAGIAGLKEKLNQSVTISGKVAKARKPGSDTAPYILNIQGDDGAVDVVFWQTLADQLGADQKPNVGDSVEITGKVGEYRGNVQVKPENPSDIKIIKGGASGGDGSTSAPQTALVELPLSQLASAKAHQQVKVSGTVETIEPVHTGKKIMLKDPSGSATLLVWDTAETGKTGIHTIKPNSKITVTATVEQDEGKPVLSVSKSEDAISVGNDSK